MSLTSRRAARVAALQALFGLDHLDEWTDALIELYLERHHPEAMKPGDHSAHVEYAINLIKGVRERRDEIDQLLSASSTHWGIHRMARVDRTILRISVFEMLASADVPFSVAINEAIELAKDFSGDESPGFVNGVLDHIAHKIGPTIFQQCADEARVKGFIPA